jgi:hypothetical protein
MKLAEVKQQIDGYFDSVKAKDIIEALEKAGVVFEDIDEMPEDWKITGEDIGYWFNEMGEYILDTNQKLYPTNLSLALAVIETGLMKEEIMPYLKECIDYVRKSKRHNWYEFICSEFNNYEHFGHLLEELSDDEPTIDKFFELMAFAINKDSDCRKEWYSTLKNLKNN